MVECAIREALEETGLHLRNDLAAGGVFNRIDW
jgi:8-oxo-dGTP pyrophosphatase MutT (NUDIX family)